MIRTIRSMSVATLLLIALAGIACYFVTQNAHDKTFTDTTLFALSWAFSAVGIIGAVATIFGCITAKKSFGTTTFLKDLFEVAAGTLVILVVAEALLLFGAGGSGQSLNAGICLSTLVAVLAGFVLGFIALFITFAREDWTSSNEQTAELHDIRNERAL